MRWLGLWDGRRDNILFSTLLIVGAIGGALAFMATDAWELRMAGLGLPFGIIAGFGLYVAVAAFLHAGEPPERSDLPRQMLIIALLSALAAHYLEIHFGIAIGATRTTFWVFTAGLMHTGRRPLAVMRAEMSVLPGEANREAAEPGPRGGTRFVGAGVAPRRGPAAPGRGVVERGGTARPPAGSRPRRPRGPPPRGRARGPAGRGPAGISASKAMARGWMSAASTSVPSDLLPSEV